MRTRPKEPGHGRLTDLLVWGAFIAPGIILNKDGSLQTTYRFRGPDLDSTTTSLFSSSPQSQHGGMEHEASLRALFQSLHRRCAHVDHYQPWSKHAYSEIAMQWWQKGNFV